MTITLPDAPRTAFDLVRDNLLLDDNVVVLASRSPRTPRTLKPHPVYTSSIKDVLENRLLAASHQTAWQYILVNGEETYALAEVATNRPERPEGLAYAARYSRENAQWTLDAINAARKTNGSMTSYELRVLRVPPLYFAAVWLHAAGDDVLFPIQPVPVAIEPNAPVTETAVTELLRPLAEQRATVPNHG